MSFGIPQEDSPLDAPPLPGHCGILVVDEDPAFQLGLKTFLREYVGFEKVFTAKNGQEALDFIRAEPSIEVITLDYRMPGMSGIEVLEALREKPPRPLGVLMITGYPSDELESEFRSMGNDLLLTTHFLSKPVEFEKLEPIVLAAHDEVIERKLQLESALEEEVPASPDTPLPLDGILQRIELQSAQIERLDHELKAQRGKWRSDFWKVVLLLLAFWLAAQFGALEKIEPHWNRLKEDIANSFVVRTPAAKVAPTDEATEEAAPEPTENPATIPEVDRGQPL